MATTTNLYDIVDENGEIIHKRKSAKEIEEIYGLKPTIVFKRLHNGWIIKGHRAIRVSGFGPNVEKQDKIGRYRKN